MKTVGHLLITFAVIESVIQLTEESENPWNHNHKLRKKLLENYDKMALPQKDLNGTTTVYLGMILNGIWIDDDKQIMTVNCLMMMHWTDDRLEWDYKDFGGMDTAHFGDGEIWKPDIQLYNNAEITEIDHYGNVHHIVYNTGLVSWVPPAKFKVNCDMDIKFWPFDEHECVIYMGSWTSNGWQINVDLTRNRTKIYVGRYESNSNWKIMSAIQKRHTRSFKFTKEFYVTIIYSFKLKRNTPSFNALTIAPAVVIPLFLLIQFVLPVDHTQRLTIGAFCSLFTLLEMIFLKFSLPKIGTNSPLIVIYFSQLFVVSIITVGLTALLNRLSHPQNPLLNFPPPEVVKRLLTGPLATVLCLRFHASKVGLSGNVSVDSEILESSNAPSYSHEWLLVARVVDRIALIFFVCLTVISFFVYIAPLK